MYQCKMLSTEQSLESSVAELP